MTTQCKFIPAIVAPVDGVRRCPGDGQEAFASGPDKPGQVMARSLEYLGSEWIRAALCAGDLLFWPPTFLIGSAGPALSASIGRDSRALWAPRWETGLRVRHSAARARAACSEDGIGWSGAQGWCGSNPSSRDDGMLRDAFQALDTGGWRVGVAGGKGSDDAAAWAGRWKMEGRYDSWWVELVVGTPRLW